MPQSVLPMALMVLLQRPAPLRTQRSAAADYPQPKVEGGTGLVPMEVDSPGAGPSNPAGPAALDKPVPSPPGTSWCVPGVAAGPPTWCKDRVWCVFSGVAHWGGCC